MCPFPTQFPYKIIIIYRKIIYKMYLITFATLSYLLVQHVYWSRLYTVLPPFKARQVHGIRADGKIFTEPLGCPACLYPWVGEALTLQATCLSACLMSWLVLPSVSLIVAPVPLCVSPHHCLQQGVPTCLGTRGEQSPKTARTLHNII